MDFFVVIRVILFVAVLYYTWRYIKLCRQYDFYLAGPMRSMPHGNKPKFIQTAKKLRSMGYSVWNPAEQNDSNLSFSKCIKKDLDAIMHQCKAIALLPGWRQSLGANTETLCAYVSSKKVYTIIEKPDGKISLIRVEIEDLLRGFRLPFGGDHCDFRGPDEMNVPEYQVFEATG